MRTRSIQFIESQILDILGKVKNGNHPIYLSLSAMGLDFAVKSPTEQKNFDAALQNLLKRGRIKQAPDDKGFKVYKLAE